MFFLSSVSPGIITVYMHMYIYTCVRRKFTSELTRHSSSVGMSMAEPYAVEFQPRRQSAEQFFNALMRKYNNLELIMAILPKKGAGSGYGV